ncbi:hypothetical protein [Actinomadura rudentiformis]|uniref:Uncharacterized protein n=1 Tax=Actinomadura rudentiformis TaxID=359158 RepID=A0A6H9YWF8_9ACTN|nr:hypothetical protein [Actinomadura rudentiformis]KAB2346069.1 hypothetical protein F8566_25535 [Actinomadura rudentiformis]
MRKLTSRLAVRLVIPSTAAAFAGLLVVPPASAQQRVDKEFVLSCTKLGGVPGEHRITARLAGGTPSRGRVKQPIVLGAFTLKVALGGEAAQSIVGPEPVSVTGTAQVAISARQSGRGVDATWPDFSVSGGQSEEGGVKLASGPAAVPGILPVAGGDVELRLARLVLRLDAREPAAAQTTLDCEPKGDRSLLRVEIPGPAPSSTSRPAPSQRAAPPESRCQKPPGDQDDFLEDKWPDHDLDIDNREPSDTVKCGTMVGYNNIEKLGGAAAVGGRLNVVAGRGHIANYKPGRNWQALFHYALPEVETSTATMLGFGFMPTTAVTKIESVGNANVAMFNPVDATQESAVPRPSWPPSRWNPDNPRLATWSFVRGKIRATVANAYVNGLPIKLGDTCASAGEIVVPVVAVLPNGTTITAGGDYRTAENELITIPRFAGCGSGGEDLSPLLTATVSGSGNRATVFQSQQCNPTDDPEDCSDRPFRWHISPLNHRYTFATGQQITIRDNTTGNSITCSPRWTWQTPAAEVGAGLGRPTWAPSTSCTASPGLTTPRMDVGLTLGLLGHSYDSPTQVARAVSQEVGIQFSYAIPGQTARCRIDARARWDGYFDNKSDVFEFRHRPGTIQSPSGGLCPTKFTPGSPFTVTVSKLTIPDLVITAKPA